MSTRDRLIEAAIELLAAGQGPTLETVAETAGVSRATAYRTFGGMPDLQASVLTVYTAQLVEEVQAAIADIDNALDAMEQVAAMTVVALQRDETLRALIPLEGLAGNEAIRSMAVNIIRPILTRGQRQGEVRTDLDVAEMVEWLMDSYLSGLAYRNMTEQEARSMYRKFFVPGLRAPSTAQPQEHTRAVAHHLQAALTLLGETPPLNGRKKR